MLVYMKKFLTIILPIFGMSFLLSACLPAQFLINNAFNQTGLQTTNDPPVAISVNTNVVGISCGQTECAVINNTTQNGISIYNTSGQLLNYISWGNNIVQNISCNFSSNYCIIFGAILGFFVVDTIWKLNLSTLQVTTVFTGNSGVAVGSCTPNLQICFANMGNLWVSTNGGNSFTEISNYIAHGQPVCSEYSCSVVVNSADMSHLYVYLINVNNNSPSITEINPSNVFDTIGCSYTCYAVYGTDINFYENTLPGVRNFFNGNSYFFYPQPTYISGIYCDLSCYIYGATAASQPAVWELTNSTSINLATIFNGNGVVTSVSNGWVSIVRQSGIQSVVEPLSDGNLANTPTNLLNSFNESSVYTDAQINYLLNNEIKNGSNSINWNYPISYIEYELNSMLSGNDKNIVGPIDYNTALSGDSISFAIMWYSGTLEAGIDIGGCSIECFEQFVLNNHPVSTSSFNYFFFGYWDIPQFEDYNWQNHLTVYNDYLTGIENYLHQKNLPIRILSVLYASGQDPKAVDTLNQGLQDYVVPQLQSAGYTNVKYCDINNIIYGNSFKYVVDGVVIRPDGVHPSNVGANYLAYVILNDCP
jgi:hypothetical protein